MKSYTKFLTEGIGPAAVYIIQYASDSASWTVVKDFVNFSGASARKFAEFLADNPGSASYKYGIPADAKTFRVIRYALGPQGEQFASVRRLKQKPTPSNTAAADRARYQEKNHAANQRASGKWK